jgi:CP family cyanate transporter-like MFS transporter
MSDLDAGGAEWPIVTTHRRQQWFILFGVVALSFNLRPAATSVGPVLGDLTNDLGMSATTAGVLTTLPVLCFAAFGALAPWAARRIGMHRVMLCALVTATAALLVRAEAPSSPLFIVTTVIALAGMATANVMLPSIIKLHFPDRIGQLTAVYATTLAIGMTMASALTVPIAEAGGSWRWGLATWGITAGLAAIPWLGLIAHDVRPEESARSQIGFLQVARTPTAWWMAVYFGMQSLHAYAMFGWLPEIFRDAGFSARDAGLLLAVTTATGIPVSFIMPRIAVRLSNQTMPVLVITAFCGAGYVGLAAWPSHGAVIWAALVGIGTGSFPLILTMIGLRTRTSDGTAALSSFTQSVGYLIGGIGPFMMGVLYDATGGWTAPLVVLMMLVIPLGLSGLLAAQPRFVEDELHARAVASC